MATFYSLGYEEVIRVKVKKCEGHMQPEIKKFSIDPQITSFEMLQGILGTAFEIKSDYTLSYQARDPQGEDVYLTILSDWDMDAAIQGAADSCLRLTMEVQPADPELDEWDVIASGEVPDPNVLHLQKRPSLMDTITGNISSHVGKTMSSVQRAIGRRHSVEAYKPVKPPMSDKEFHSYLDSAGFMVKAREFRLSVYQGGIQSSLRPVAWRHLLCIFPENLSGLERFEYLKRKEREYYCLRDEWKERFSRGSTTEEVEHVALMVKKDVLRTDRKHRVYAGGDNNRNVQRLFNVLVTYALTHPDVSYCQGMSDLASPLLVTQKDEAQTYICFCSLMTHLQGNFSADGTAMMTQFRHLAELLQVHDSAFYEYLQSINAHDFIFCYRWLLLQLKREFPFEDALYMLEVMWSTLPLTQPKDNLPLVDPYYNVKLLSTSCSPSFSFQQSVYTKLLAMRFSSRAKDLAVDSCGDSQQLPAPVQESDQAVEGSDHSQHPYSTDQESDQAVDGSDHSQHPYSPDEEHDHHSQSSDGSGFEISLADHDQVSEYSPVDDVDTCCLQQRSNGISQVLQENKLTLSSTEHDCCHQQSLTDDNSEKGLKDLSASVSCSVGCRQRRYSETRDIEESSGTDNSFVNVSIELGTADLASTLNPSCDSSPFQDVDREELFTLSLDSEPASSAKTEGEDEGYSGSKKKQPACPKPQNCSASVTSTEPSSHKPQFERGRSDSGMSEGSWSGGQQSQTKMETRPQLPPPDQFGNGNPFLMFLCLTMLLQHRDKIISSTMEYEDVAMFFTKMVRQHNVHKVLHQARKLYSDYLHAQKTLAHHTDFYLSI